MKSNGLLKYPSLSGQFTTELSSTWSKTVSLEPNYVVFTKPMFMETDRVLGIGDNNRSKMDLIFICTEVTVGV